MTTPNSMKILIVEDDVKTSDLLVTYFQREGFATVAAFDGQAALSAFGEHKPHLVILDIMLPILDGWEVCRSIRKDADTPIIFLTSRDDESDTVLGLGLGGDDYVIKPFSPREIVARVKATLRRTYHSRESVHGLYKHGGLVFDMEKRRISLNGEPLTLTPSEYGLLETLMLSPGRVFYRDELLRKLYPDGEMVTPRVIDVHIGKLRQKIEQDPTNPQKILTIRGLGYQFVDP